MPHIHELYDFTVSIFIVFDSKVLLVNHPRYNMWIPIGGHIELDEDPEQAVYREAKEESGLDIELISHSPNIKSSGTKFLPNPNYLDVHEANTPHHHIALTYFAQAKNDKSILSDEHSEMRWLSLEDLHKPEYQLSEAVIFYSTEAIKICRK